MGGNNDDSNLRVLCKKYNIGRNGTDYDIFKDNPLNKEETAQRSEKDTECSRVSDTASASDISEPEPEPEKDVASAPSFFQKIQKYFSNAYKLRFKSEPAISFGKEGKIVKRVAGLFKDIDEAYRLIDDFLVSEKGKKYGYTLSVCFSANTINLWRAGKLDNIDFHSDNNPTFCFVMSQNN